MHMLINFTEDVYNVRGELIYEDTALLYEDTALLYEDTALIWILVKFRLCAKLLD